MFTSQQERRSTLVTAAACPPPRRTPLVSIVCRLLKIMTTDAASFSFWAVRIVISETLKNEMMIGAMRWMRMAPAVPMKRAMRVI